MPCISQASVIVLRRNNDWKSTDTDGTRYAASERLRDAVVRQGVKLPTVRDSDGYRTIEVDREFYETHQDTFTRAGFEEVL